MQTKLKRCAGCLKSWSQQHLPELACVFRNTGFPFEDSLNCLPCGIQYCAKCYQAGPPFKTRLAGGKGLCFPKALPALFPNFICEACQVRVILDRELGRSGEDMLLLMLERMRQLDAMHKWAEGTVQKYGGQI